MNADDFPTECHDLLRTLRTGADRTEPVVFHNSLVQSDYAVVFTNNAIELVDSTSTDDFAMPGALYMLRHGLELWLKCILANRNLDRLLAVITGERLTFEALSAHDVMTEGRIRSVQKANARALKAALCAMRNVVVDGMCYPECRTKRLETRFADLAIALLHESPDLPRQRLGVLYVPLIGGHKLMPLWEAARPYVEDLHAGASRHAHEVSGGAALEPDRVEEICALLHHVDPRGESLRYPFSLDGSWHTRRLGFSLTAVGCLARALTASIRCHTGFRSEVYSQTTVRDPVGPLYLGDAY